MRIEMLPGTMNVVRFPVERRARPTLDLLRDIAPDAREVLVIAEAFDIEAPAPDLRARADRETAEYILNQVAGSGSEIMASVDALLDPVVAKAIAACRAAHDLSIDAAEAQQVLQRARTAGHFWIDPLRERAEALLRRSAELLIEAHARYEEAEGVARAVGLARRGETWTPRDHRAEEEALFGPMVRRAI
jgi:hypothetical protein